MNCSVQNSSLDFCDNDHHKITDEKFKGAHTSDSYFAEYDVASGMKKEKSNFKRFKKWFDDMVRLTSNRIFKEVFNIY